jgi:hypothetical protein
VIGYALAPDVVNGYVSTMMSKFSTETPPAMTNHTQRADVFPGTFSDAFPPSGEVRAGADSAAAVQTGSAAAENARDAAGPVTSKPEANSAAAKNRNDSNGSVGPARAGSNLAASEGSGAGNPQSGTAGSHTAVPPDNGAAAAVPAENNAAKTGSENQAVRATDPSSNSAVPTPGAGAPASLGGGAATGLNAAKTAPAETRVQAVRKGWLAVSAEPPAEIFIDGLYVGDTPVARIEITSGPHTLECKAPKHEPYSETIKIVAGELSTRNIVLTRLAGRVSLSTTEGAEVYVDGVFKGVTPLTGPIELDVGNHQITVKKAGFHVWNNVVTVDAAQLLPLKITLSPIY